MSGRETTPRLRVVLVTGLSGAGKLSVLRALEDLGYEAVDNPPLAMTEDMATRADRNLAIGVDARIRGFDATRVLEAVCRLRGNPALRPDLVYVTAEDSVLLRRYTETRRRHPLAPQGRVIDGIEEERVLTAALRDSADLLIDTSELPVSAMRELVERHFGGAGDDTARMVITLVSFAYPLGLPRDADLVFDARFLRNPHYDPILQPRTGLDPEVGAYVEADPDFPALMSKLSGLLELLLPRFVREGKKYLTIAIGCTGGRHRSVYVVERLAALLAGRSDWRLLVAHRELARDGHASAYLADRPAARLDADNGQSFGGDALPPVQAQEA
ncbi:MAG: RNase adapter RapZ [Acetobacteraceae bacterium]